MGPRLPRSASVIGWTGRGSPDDLKASAVAVLKSAGMEGKVSVSGTALVVRGPDPARVGSALGNTPGASWVALGMASETLGQVRRGAKLLARRYLKPGSRFKVEATGGPGVSSSDVGGAATSSVVDEVRGARVDEVRPQVVLRAGLAESGGFVGVEIARGPGGTPTGTREVVCLVSGGLHSSVLSWMALLSGFRVRMVHAKEDEESVLGVARLYTELSHRVEPSALALEVLVGRDPAMMLNWLSGQEGGQVFLGSHSGCGERPRSLRSVAEAPLYLAQEDWFLSEARGLVSKMDGGRTNWSGKLQAPDRIFRFDGMGGDVNHVLDGLRRQPRSGR